MHIVHHVQTKEFLCSIAKSTIRLLMIEVNLKNIIAGISEIKTTLKMRKYILMSFFDGSSTFVQIDLL